MRLCALFPILFGCTGGETEVYSEGPVAAVEVVSESRSVSLNGSDSDSVPLELSERQVVRHRDGERTQGARALKPS